MNRRNVIGIDTKHGYRTFELYEGDITALGRAVDVVVVSAYAGNYDTVPGTVVGAMFTNLGLDVQACLTEAAFDFRSALGVWISRPLKGFEFERLLCAEFLGSGFSITDVVENVFVGLSILEAKGGSVRRVALPVLGTGSQSLNAHAVCECLLKGAKDFFQRSASCETILFVEIDAPRVDQLDEAMDAVLGRSKVVLPRRQLLDSLRADIANRLLDSADLFSPDSQDLRTDWMRALEAEAIRSFELGVLARRLLELLIARFGIQSKEPLYRRIDALEAAQIAPWIRGYMHVLRHLGNEAAHEGQRHTRRPPYVEETDLGLCLSCVARLLEFWAQNRQPTA